MATTLSRYLKLKLDSNLTANAKYNLERIDTLGSSFVVDSSSQLNIRSEADVLIEPRSPDLGGSGVGGTVSIGTQDHSIASLSVYADSVTFSNPLTFPNGSIFVTGGTLSFTLSSDLAFTLPADYGTSGQVLATDGTGTLEWVNQSGGGGGSSASTDWVTGDGTSKSFTHSLGSSDISVSLHDSTTKQVIMIDTITVTDLNTVTLTASEAPSASWRITVQT